MAYVMRRRKLLRRGALLGAVGLAGCSSGEDGAQTGLDTETEAETDNSGQTSSSDSGDGGTVRIGLPEEIPPIMDTRKAADDGAHNYRVISTLTTFDLEGSVQPHLATDWSFENDGAELVLELRDDVTFHDGSEFNAEHVKWHLTDFLANGGGTSYIVSGVDDVVVEDTYRARVMFSSPDPYILWDLASAWGQIHSREAVEEYGDEYGQSGKVVSAGPFKEIEHDSDHAVLERYEEWDWPKPWQEELFEGDVEVRPKRLEYQSYPETATRTSAFEAGDIDGMIAGVPYSKFPNYQESDQYNTGTPPVSTEQIFIMLNLNPETSTAPVLAEDLSLRKGISYGIDRQEIVDVVFNGVGDPAPNYLVPSVEAHDIPEEYNYTYDLEQARTVMRDNGWTVNPGGVSTKDGREASFTLLTQNTGLSRRRATLIKEQLKDIGVEMNVSTTDTSTFKADVGSGNFAAGMSTFYDWGNADQLWWTTSESAEDSYYLNSNAWNQFPRATELTDRAKNATTLEERTQRYKEAHKYLLEDVVPMVYLMYPKGADAWGSHVQNWEPHYKGAPMWPVESDEW
ncbi:ABC transporter substrate-binding protein [Halobellus clavatus]|uniref:ABC-type transport system, substrate-binding protein n=1 Tax=Halobellus clavatus TaxID=660517 RepID=A0A1H3IFY9_9EURY|nr:ABC transporter substrate-binding protein [Halobellus clavatus]SDY25754.1 ABC-type transport system, substrate-binding protein [Halobellus clavatus]